MARAWGVLVAGMVLFGAGFLPWLVIRVIKGSGGDVWTIRIWAWAGALALKPFGVRVPAGTVPAAGLACAILAVATLAGRRVPWKVPFFLALYAFGYAAVGFVSSVRDYGVGLPLSVASALAIAVLSWPRKAPADPAAR